MSIRSLLALLCAISLFIPIPVFADLPNDPEAASQIYLTNLDSNAVIPLFVNAEDAWDTVTDNEDIVIAVIDSGIDTSHEDLADNIWINQEEVPDNGVDDDENGYIDDYHGYHPAKRETHSVVDEMNHGTRVAGVLGAVGNNGVGMTGMIQRTRIMPIKTTIQVDGEMIPGDEATTVQSLDYVLTMKQKGINIRIVNLSGGIPEACSSLYRSLLKELSDHGVLVVAAAGNEGVNLGETDLVPATCPSDNVLTVAASGMNGGLLTIDGELRSNFNTSHVDLAAPGDRLITTSATTENRYTNFSGTSAATPLVSGVAALILSENPHLSPSEIIDVIVNNVRSSPALQELVSSGGLLNAAQAVENVPAGVTVSGILTRSGSGAFNDHHEVILRNTTGGILRRSTPSLNGSYSFEEVLPGEYQVEFLSRRQTDFFSPQSLVITVSDQDFTIEPVQAALHSSTDNAPPFVSRISFNAGLIDPPDRPIGEQNTDWMTQQSFIRRITVEFSETVHVADNDIRIIIMGTDPTDKDGEVIEVNGVSGNDRTVRLPRQTVQFDIPLDDRMPDGVLKIIVSPSVHDSSGNLLDGNQDGTEGDRHVFFGSETNRGYQLTFDFNGDGKYTIFDFRTFAYWFGDTGATPPEYVDLNNDGGVSIFDLPPHSSFASSVNFDY